MAQDQDLFEMQSGCTQEHGRNTTDGQTRVTVASHRLAVDFTDQAGLPVRFRKSSSSTKSRKINEDSEVEMRFKAKVTLWTQLIETMLAKISDRQAWRFIDLSPEIGPTTQKLTDCKDFCDFMDYLILRRDKEECNADELGGLALLSIAFQREIEKRIQQQQATEVSERAGPSDA